jgi:sulfotransferase family protein
MTARLRRYTSSSAPTKSQTGASVPRGPKWRFDEVRADDVYLISFPRSGNTWLRYQLAALMHGPQTDPARVTATVPDIHASDPSIRPDPGPIWVKSHMPASGGPLDARVIYLIRNGLDATASYHRYLRQRGRLAPDASLDDFLDGSDMWPCDWTAHVEGWLDEIETRAESEALIVRYEDLLGRPVDEMEKVVDFLGIDGGRSRIEEAIGLATRARMRDDEARAGQGSLNHVGGGADRPPEGPAAERFLARARPTLLRAGYRPA